MMVKKNVRFDDKEYKWELKVQKIHKPVLPLIEKYWGKRCRTYCPSCPLCQEWKKLLSFKTEKQVLDWTVKTALDVLRKE